VDIPWRVREAIRLAVEEDLGHGDITSEALLSERCTHSGYFLAKQSFVLAGIPFTREVFRVIDPTVELLPELNEGARVSKGDVLARVSGKTASLLAGERVGLNILQRLSGIATLTRSYVDKIAGTRAKILDTRKTTPCIREMEKYAVRTGGGFNHRFGLSDGILIKDNHLMAVGSVHDAVRTVKRKHPLKRVEVEVGSIVELQEAVRAGADVVMLDNMKIDEIRKAVKTARGKVLLEVSGSVNLKNVRQIAETGVHYISVGALTHSATSVDISMKIGKESQ
jgi:nicotinate-nucleotide pyrophosphorylase (carboxylating)